MSRDPHEGINVRDPGTGDGHYPPQSVPNQESQGMSNFVDGSGPIFSMYLETATEEDKKMAENWKADAEGILIFTGLFSAAVASLISVSIQDIRSNPQDTSNFYLANIYQTVADPNSSNISNSLPSPPSFSPPNYAVWVNALWFMSLVISLTCALLATLLQQWARRYLKVTQPHYAPHKRARIRSFFFEGVDKYLVLWVGDALPSLLHVSLFLFFGGLVVFLSNVDITIFKLVLSWVGVCTAIYGCITFFPIFCHDSPYSTPLTSLAWPTVTGTSFIVFHVLMWFDNRFDCFTSETYNRFYDLARHYRKSLVQGMQKTAEETALNSPSEIDTRAFMWTFDSLDEDHELERFFFGLPGFRSSKVVDDPLPSLSWEQKMKLLIGLIGLSDRTFSSDLLPEAVKSRRAAICVKALGLGEITNSDLHLLQEILSDRQFMPVESVGIANILREWGYTKVENISMVASAVVSSVVANARRRDDLWFGIASNELGIPESVLRDYAAHGDSLSLAILIHITCQQFIHFQERLWPWFKFSKVLETASKFNVEDTSAELQHKFCTLWNQIVLKVQNDDDKWMAFLILGRIRNIYVALHQGTDCAPTRFSASTGDRTILLDPSSYPLCNIAGHIHDDPAPTTFTPIATLASDSFASPDPPSSSIPTPHHPDEGPMDVPPPDDNTYAPPSFHPSHHTTLEKLCIPTTSPDPATAGAIQDIVTSGTTKPRPTPEISASAPPLSSTPSSDVVAVPYIADHHTPLDGPDVQSPPSPIPVLDIMLHAGLQLSSDPPLTGSGCCAPSPEFHSSMLAPAAPFAPSPRSTSAPYLGTAVRGKGNLKADLRKDNHTLDPPSTIREDIMAISELPPQSPSPSLVTGVTIVGTSLYTPDAEHTGDDPPHTSNGQYDIV